VTPGEEKPGPCTWCSRPITLVWRLYTDPILAGEGYWSGERCNCILGLQRGGTTQLRMGRDRIASRAARAGSPPPAASAPAGDTPA